jgi:hypothetical protein
MNPHIDPVYWWLTASTLPLWLAAIWCNVVAVHGGVLEAVKLRAATAMLAVIYFVATVVLLFSDINPAAWSDALRGLQWLTLPIVWVAPAHMSVRMATKIREADTRLVDRHGVD